MTGVVPFIPITSTPNIRLATPDDAHLPAYDFTLLSAVNTCPKWGVIRYVHGKAMPRAGRATALEMGAMLHEAFAVCRLALLQEQGYVDHAQHHGERLFGEDRWEAIVGKGLDAIVPEYTVENIYRAGMAAMDTFGWEDDPYDNKRTMANAQDALGLYVEDWVSRHDTLIWVADENDPKAPIGVEIKLDIVISLTVTQYVLRQLGPPPVCVRHISHDLAEISFRYVGRMDGIGMHGDTANPIYAVHENKTASRINEAWKQSHLLSHQNTGYCVAASLYTGRVVQHAYAIGLVIPKPKRDVFNGVVWELTTRQNYHILRWLQWVLQTCEVIWKWTDDPINAPMYTHSCNRYFRPCPYVPLCYEDEDQQHQIFNNEMVLDKWSPLKEINQSSVEE